MVGGLGPTELVIIAALFFTLFGAKKIPEFARSLGQAEREFTHARREGAKALELEEPKDDAIDVESKSVSSNPAKPNREKTLKVAKELNIDVEGRSLEEIKAEIDRTLAN